MAPPRPQPDVPALVAGARAGEARAVARLVSLVESASPRLPDVMAALAPYTGRAHVVGVTGAPGVGKSTTTAALVGVWRAEGRRVGVLAVDPSSPLSGGALLGDRIRMGLHATDPGVFIRSMAARGHLGGLAWAAPQAVRVMEAAECDVVLVETVGVGQSETEVAGLADSTVVLLAPGMGDQIQAAKAGVLEIGDVYVVNKADRDGARQVRRDLRAVLGMAERPAGAWRPPVLATTATTGEGVAEVSAALAAHREHLERSGELERRRLRRARDEVEAVVLTRLRDRWEAASPAGAGSRVDRLAAQVAAGQTDPYRAAEQLLG